MEVEEDFETAIKVIVVGNGGVGKTSMIKRFCKGEWTDGYKKTIGVDFLEKDQYVKNLDQTVRMMLWDTAGQEEFDAITRTYYRGAGACVIAFSTTDRESFEAVDLWKKKVEAECGPLPMALVQNKVDLIEKAVLNSTEAEETAKRLGLKFYRTCVKDNYNVAEVFEYLATVHVKRKAPASQSNLSPATGTIGKVPTQSVNGSRAIDQAAIVQAPSQSQQQNSVGGRSIGSKKKANDGRIDLHAGAAKAKSKKKNVTGCIIL
mmetsp:Transcript_26275/g.45203  ORF Transcript_26275/g.45203 Transcript_26275/m.45203 type:complete len:262 (-) Transcript_26275:544-1329(-)